LITTQYAKYVIPSTNIQKTKTPENNQTSALLHWINSLPSVFTVCSASKYCVLLHNWSTERFYIIY